MTPTKPEELSEELRHWYIRASRGPDSDGVLRLIVRLLSIFFLKEKGLVPPKLFDETWVNESLMENDECGYYNAILRHLFFRCFNTPIAERGDLEHKKSIKNIRHIKEQFDNIPFLGGGFFDEHPGDDFAWSNEYFFSGVNGLVTILKKYRYTLDETDDPALIGPDFIGKVFESLMACVDSEGNENRRKMTGSFYTPREIVDDMANAALDAHLEINEQSRNRKIAQSHDCGSVNGLKILDPACGCGEFPCGVLNAMMKRFATHKTLSQQERYAKKSEILRNVIYGLEIQPMAVQITRLRLLLSLLQEIVPNQQKTNFGIEPLPNLETKIVCADALTRSPIFDVEKFDIVLGNPPYLKAEYFTEKQRAEYRNIFHRYADLYVYFIETGFKMLKDGGTLCFITNDGFLGFKKTEHLRTLFFDNDLRQIVSCGKIFDDAGIYTAMFLVKKQKSETERYETRRYDREKKAFFKTGAVDYSLSQHLVHRRLVVNSPIATLYAKLLTGGKMGDICSILDTGIHTGNCRTKLLFREREEPNLEKVLQGKQISRYAFDWDDPQARFKYCDVGYVPADVFGVGRNGKPSQAKEYWHFCGDPSNHRACEKILLRQTGYDLVACYVNREKDGLFYTDNTLFTVLPKADYSIFFVLGLLNSRLLNALYHFLSQEAGKALAQVKTQVVCSLPVPLVEPAIQKTLADFVLRRLRGELPDEEIDQYVDQIYGLSAEEIDSTR